MGLSRGEVRTRAGFWSGRGHQIGKVGAGKRIEVKESNDEILLLGNHVQHFPQRPGERLAWLRLPSRFFVVGCKTESSHGADGLAATDRQLARGHGNPLSFFLFFLMGEKEFLIFSGRLASRLLPRQVIVAELILVGWLGLLFVQTDKSMPFRYADFSGEQHQGVVHPHFPAEVPARGAVQLHRVSGDTCQGIGPLLFGHLEGEVHELLQPFQERLG